MFREGFGVRGFQVWRFRLESLCVNLGVWEAHTNLGGLALGFYSFESWSGSLGPLPKDSYVVPFWVCYVFFSSGIITCCPKRNYIGGSGYILALLGFKLFRVLGFGGLGL